MSCGFKQKSIMRCVMDIIRQMKGEGRVENGRRTADDGQLTPLVVYCPQSIIDDEEHDYADETAAVAA